MYKTCHSNEHHRDETFEKFKKDLKWSLSYQRETIDDQQSSKIFSEIYEIDTTFTIDPSETSVFNIDEISQISFGAFSSRFWALRMHFNYLEND